MQVIILAGGLGTRLSEETSLIPKPMVTIGQDPILVHIMRYYASFGHNEFIIALGYKGAVIKDYFRNFSYNLANLRVNTKHKTLEILNDASFDWTIDLVDTGINSATGGRLLRLDSFLQDTFLMTYGDGLGNVNISNLVKLHSTQNTIATVTAVQPPARFGALEIENSRVKLFREKSISDVSWINGGFFVLNKKVLDFIPSDDTSFENEPMQKLAERNELSAYKHDGFWQPMDTLRDRQQLEEIWRTGNPPWVVN